MLVEYAADHLPDGWEETHDYWGAKCFAYKPRQRAPRTGTLFAGDSCGYFMFFADFQSLEEYTEQVIADLAEAQSKLDDEAEERQWIAEQEYKQHEND